jgi:8-oxoguanine deaminase
MPRTLLVKNADVLVTVDAARQEIRNGGLFVSGNRIVVKDGRLTTAKLPRISETQNRLARALAG